MGGFSSGIQTCRRRESDLSGSRWTRRAGRLQHCCARRWASRTENPEWGDGGGRLLIWDEAQKGQPPIELGRHDGWMRSMAVLNDGKIVAGIADQGRGQPSSLTPRDRGPRRPRYLNVAVDCLRSQLFLAIGLLSRLAAGYRRGSCRTRYPVSQLSRALHTKSFRARAAAAMQTLLCCTRVRIRGRAGGSSRRRSSLRCAEPSSQ